VLARAQEAFGQAFEVAFASQLSDAAVSTMWQLLRKLLEGNGAWADARCEPALVEHDPPTTD
jgi:hypothetical protein